MEDNYIYSIRMIISHVFDNEDLSKEDSILYAQFSSLEACESEYDRLVEVYGDNVFNEFYIDIE